MNRKNSLLFLIILVCQSALSYAQPWSGVLDAKRAIDWSQAGVGGGIASRTAICSTLNPGATAAQINTAISNCPSGQVVYLNAGTYNISGLYLKSNVTLRGAGADKTFLVFTGNASSCTLPSDVCFQNGFVWHGGSSVQPGGSNAATWSSGFAKGTTSIVLNNIGSAGLSIGQYIYLDQANDTADTGNLYICDDACSAQGGSPGRTINGVNHSQTQAVKITACSPSCTNGATFTISPGLYASNWRSSQVPGAYWSGTIQNAGLEDLSMDHSATGSSSGGGVVFAGAFNCWVKGVRSVSNGSYRNHIWLFQSAHNTVRDSYFFGAPGASLSYGVESRVATDDMVINNIFQHVTTPMIAGTSQGEVYSYNFSINDYYSAAPSFLDQSSYAHDAGTMFTLLEGNVGNGFRADIIHGGSGLNTLFRNRYNGWESGKTQQLQPLIINSYNRYLNVIGNVFGESGVQTAYQNSGTPIYDIGNGDCCDGTSIPNDALVVSTLMRWGNYDTVSGAVRWVSSEVPSSASAYPNAVPPSQTLPASFYLSSKPSWWPLAKAWPAIGPEVTGGNIANVGGHAYTIPAQDCYSTTMRGPADGSGNALNFNASACYAQSGTTPPPPPAPAPPTNLTSVPR